MTTTLSQTQCVLTKAKIKARSWMPYMSHVLGIMRTHVTDKVQTMSVDENARLYINEPFLHSLTANQVAYCLLHEVLHIVLSHGRRFRAMIPHAGERERLCWNISADLCIQQMLARHLSQQEPNGIVRIDGVLPYSQGVKFLDLPGVQRGMSTEQYYGLILPFLVEPPSGDQGGSPGGQPLDPKDAGSNSHGEGEDYERGSTVLEKAMLDNALEQAAKAIEEAESSQPGTTPGGLLKTLQLRLRRQPDPFAELRHVVSRTVASPLGQDEYTYRRLSRRQPHDAVRKRGVVRYAPECSIIVDTSGSMSGFEQKALTAVAQGLRKVQQPRVVLYDAAIQDERRMSSIEAFQWKGYGGTDMTRALEYVDQNHRPDAIVLITDGETRWPTKPTRARLIIALVKRHDCVPAWAKVVHCYKEVATYEH